MRGLAMTACLALTACATQPPKVVTVVVEKIVPVPVELTKPCPVYRAKRQTVGEAITGHNINAARLEECDARMKQIRELGQ